MGDTTILGGEGATQTDGPDHRLPLERQIVPGPMGNVYRKADNLVDLADRRRSLLQELQQVEGAIVKRTVDTTPEYAWESRFWLWAKKWAWRVIYHNEYHWVKELHCPMLGNRHRVASICPCDFQGAECDLPRGLVMRLG